MDQITRFRINLTTREIEIEGSEMFVKEQLEKFQDFIDAYRNSSAVLDEPMNKGGLINPPSYVSGGLPATFGEYFHGFPNTITQKDQILIAGYFVQKKSTDNSFTTESANSLLVDLGVKLSNASDSVGKNKVSKYIFPVTKGFFRVSKLGEDYINSLLGNSK